jgi:hypothetical protein
MQTRRIALFFVALLLVFLFAWRFGTRDRSPAKGAAASIGGVASFGDRCLLGSVFLFPQVGQLPELLAGNAIDKDITRFDVCARNDVNEEFINSLARARRIQEFIIGRHLTNDGLSALCKITDIVSLEIIDNALCTDESGILLGELPNLCHLYLTCPLMGTKTISNLSKCRELRILISSAHTNNDGLTSLSGNARLEVLSLMSSNFTGEGVRSLHSLKALIRLSLGFCRMNDRDLSSLLDSLPNLENLWLDADGLTDVGLAAAISKPGLKEITLKRCEFGNCSLAALNKAPWVRKISVDAGMISRNMRLQVRSLRPDIVLSASED